MARRARLHVLYPDAGCTIPPRTKSPQTRWFVVVEYDGIGTMPTRVLSQISNAVLLDLFGVLYVVGLGRRTVL
jgi:hypothetical protein